MLVMNFVFGILRNLGPIICIALLVWGALGVRGCYRSLFPKDRFVGNMTSVIEEIRSVNKLKVLRVVDAGLDTYPALGNDEARKDGYVDFQYSGIVDLYVDMSKMTVEIAPSNRYIVSLGRMEMTPVREFTLTRNLPMDTSDKLSIEEYRVFYGPNQDRLHTDFGKIQATSVKKSAICKDNVDRAKRQAETLLRNMFAPFVDDKNRDITFRWAAEDAACKE